MSSPPVVPSREERLAEALRRFGAHAPSCRLNTIMNPRAYRRAGGQARCTCGWREAARTLLGIELPEGA